MQSSAVFVLLFLAACAASKPPATEPPTQATVELQKRADEKAQADQKNFDAFSQKMNEYQDMLWLCEKVSNSDEDRETRAACKRRLEAIKAELIELSRRLQADQ
jgi:hypothetical protein